MFLRCLTYVTLATLVGGCSLLFRESESDTLDANPGDGRSADASLSLDAGDCPNGWKGREGSCYQILVDVEHTTNDANDRCVNQGGHLAVIGSWDEQDWIRENFPESARVWIGLYWDDPVKLWKTVTGETPEVFCDPGNACTALFFPTLATTSCVYMSLNVLGPTRGVWSAGSCSSTHYTLCEIDGNVVTNPPP